MPIKIKINKTKIYKRIYKNVIAVYSFELSPDDPNFHAYIEGAPEGMIREDLTGCKYYVV